MTLRVNRLRLTVLLAAGTALFAAACGASASTPTAAGQSPATSAPPTTSMQGMDHGNAGSTPNTQPGSTSADPHAGMEMGQVIPGTATGDSPCEKSGAPASPGQAADGMSERGMVKQVVIDAPTRAELQQQQIKAREAAAKYPSVKDAEAAGYKKSTAYVTCIGAHYTNIPLAAKFDPGAPSELLFDGTEPDSKIVGLSYLVLNPGGAPEGFAGPNDRWHQHNSNGGLCLKGGVVVGGEESTAEACKSAGGKKTELKDIWMLHDWVVPGWECSWGTFSGECPELGGKTGTSAWQQ